MTHLFLKIWQISLSPSDHPTVSEGTAEKAGKQGREQEGRKGKSLAKEEKEKKKALLLRRRY